MPRRTTITRPPQASSLEGLESHLEQCLTARQTHIEAIAQIDVVLRLVYARLSEDVPSAIPDEPAPATADATPVPAPAALLPDPVLPRPTVKARPPKPVVSLEDDAKRVLALIAAGVQAPRALAAKTHFPRHHMRRVLALLESSERITAAGTTRSRRYSVARPRPTMPARRVVSEGVELETVWSGQKTDPSLLGERTTRERVTA